MIPNNKNIRVDIERVCNIFKKELKDVTESEWEELKVFKQKITISSAFAHKFYKKSNEIESRDLPNQ